MDDGALVGAGSHSPYGCIIVMCSFHQGTLDFEIEPSILGECP
jgi:hypothetical protein